MRILAIRGENLASLEGSFEVDLEHGALGRSGLFSISGPTGSGKSTLLDAMCLALYDQIPRLADARVVYVGNREDEDDRENARDVKSIMRRGAGHCRAEVEFIGRDSVRYLARWEARRARNKPDGRLQNQTVNLERLDTGEAIGDTRTNTLEQIRERVGLSFDQFRRSVLLAQGDFAAFLKSAANERADLLERMTGTEIYSRISEAAYNRMRDEEGALSKLSEERARLELLEEAERADLEGRLAGSRVRLSEDQATHKSMSKAIAWYEDLASLAGEVSSGERAADDARDKWEAAAPRRDIVSRIREAEPLRSALEGLDRVAGQQQSFERKREEAASRERGALARMEEAVKTVGSISSHLVKLGARARRIVTDADRWLDEHDAVSAIEGTWKQSVRDIEELAGKSAALRAEIAKAEKLVPDLEGIAGDHFDHALAEAIEDARTGMKAAQDAFSLEDHRAQLVDGAPCPLCGSEVHPWAEASPLTRLVTEREALVESLESMDRKIGQLGPAVDDIRSRLADALEPIDDWERKIEDDRRQFVEELNREVERYRREKENRAVSSQIMGRVDALFSVEERGRMADAGSDEGSEYADRDPDEIIDELRAARRDEQAARDSATKASADVSALTEHIEALAAEREALATDLARRSELAGISMDELRERLKRDPAWVASEEKSLIEIERSLQTARDVLAERRRLEREHLDSPSPSVPQEEARSAIDRIDAVIERQHREIAELDSRLKNDELTRNRAGSLDGSIEIQRAKTELWTRMGKLIGSSDGNKLRRFAQSLTLEALVAHANVHLEDLSRRYRLERVPSTDMDIQVVDREMADEIRGVNSLSGGETFLVSLALALGLASLSAREMSVESLFIDEGFGSLDIETLEIALGALESLQASGRQVGIISHVQGLGEHLGAQVLVEKTGAGRSRVVTGADLSVFSSES